VSKTLFALRVLAALPLIAIGIQHLTGMAPMQPILEGAGLPLPELSAVVAPVMEVVAGALLLVGFQARLGALLAAGAMTGALFAHVRFDWAGEPPMVLPAAILVMAMVVFSGGAGAASLDGRRSRASSATAGIQA